MTLAGSTTSNTAQIVSGKAGGYQVLTLDDARDLTFNQLLGINNEGVIAGYFGSGNAGHPNKGYVLRPPFAQGDFGGENFPDAKQTQITGLNDDGISVGFFSTQNGATPADDNNFGFWRINGHLPRGQLPDDEQLQAAGQPAARHQRHRHGRSASTTTARATPTATPTTSKPGDSS